jgi:hypothetical protein
MSVGLSRRAFLAGGASLAAIGAVSGVVSRGAAAVLHPARLKNLALRRSTFVPLVGQPFQIAHDQGSLTVVLREVSDLGPSVRPGAEGQFSLTFADAGLRSALPQETYSFSQPRLGRISLFIVPVGLARTAQLYQAIINSPR